MRDITRIFLALLFCAAAAYTQLAWGDDEHFEFGPPEDDASFSDEEFPMLDVEDLENKVVDVGPLEVPTRARKPPVPLLFAATTEILQSWKKSEEVPTATTPKKEPAPRSIASIPEQTLSLTRSALEQEGQFQEHVMEASLGDIPATYKKILSVITTGRITPRPIRDTGR